MVTLEARNMWVSFKFLLLSTKFLLLSTGDAIDISLTLYDSLGMFGNVSAFGFGPDYLMKGYQGVSREASLAFTSIFNRDMEMVIFYVRKKNMVVLQIF
jgi:hypothetical protein